MKPKFEEIQAYPYTANLHTNGRNVQYKIVHTGDSMTILCECGAMFRDPKANSKFQQHNRDGTHIRRMK